MGILSVPDNFNLKPIKEPKSIEALLELGEQLYSNNLLKTEAVFFEYDYERFALLLHIKRITSQLNATGDTFYDYFDYFKLISKENIGIALQPTILVNGEPTKVQTRVFGGEEEIEIRDGFIYFDIYQPTSTEAVFVMQGLGFIN